MLRPHGGVDCRLFATMKMARMTAWSRFLFLRHGETDWNLQGRFQGHSDIPLNATGLVQARDAAAKLKSQTVHRIVSSPLVRALKTAAIVAEHIGLPIYVDSQFSERSFGSFDGQVIAEVKRQHGLAPSELAHRIFPPDAEKWPQTLARGHRNLARRASCGDDPVRGPRWHFPRAFGDFARFMAREPARHALRIRARA